MNSPAIIFIIGMLSIPFLGCEPGRDGSAPTGTATAEKTPPPATATAKAASKKSKSKSKSNRLRNNVSVADIIKRLDGKIAFHTQRGMKKKQWLDLDIAASAHMARSQTVGSLEDLDEAGRRLEQSFEYAPKRMGPLLTRAKHLMANHRFSDASEVLDELKTRGRHPDGRLAVIAGMKGTIAFQTGNHAKALERLQAALAFKRTPSTLALLANYYANTGDLEKAKALLDDAIKIPVPALGLGRAWIRLQRGLMDLAAGRPADALVYYRKAQAQLAGWYLVEEHIAEALADTGKTEEALAIYTQVIEKNPDPLFMVAISDLCETLGRKEESASWAERARKALDDRIEKYPAATAGHVLDYFIERGEPKRALELAEENHALRPGGEAKTLLAQAALRNGKTDKAKALVEEVAKTPYSTATYHATAAIVFDKAGDKASAGAARKRAIALAPNAMEDLAWLSK